MAVGDVDGTVSLLKVCESLSSPQKDEKAGINNMFEREARREKNLEVREREMKRGIEMKQGDEDDDKKICNDEEAALRAIDEKFKAML